jgi:hypothetical protein
MDEFDIDVRPTGKIPHQLDENQTIENEEAGEPEDYDYSCYR